MLAWYMLSFRGVIELGLPVRTSVRPFVTSRSSTKMAKPRITQRTPYDSPGTLSLLIPETSAKYKRVGPNGDSK